MSKYPGNILTDNAPVYNPASGGGTPGLWSLNDAAYAAQNQSWNMYDPYWKNTTLLLNGENAANAAQNNTFLDSSINNFTITRNGNTTQGTFSPYGNLWSNYFDGTGDYLTFPVNSAFTFSSDFSVEFWVNPSTTGNNRTLFSSVDYWKYAFLVHMSSTNTINWYICDVESAGSSYDSITGSIVCPIGAWSHVAVTRSGTSVKLFVNGVLAGSTTSSKTNFVASNPWTIGADGGSYVGQQPFTGYISNIRAVKGTALYTSNFTPSTTPLTAVSGTSLLTCQSNRFKDNSSNNFTLTVNGNTSVQRFSPFNPTAPYSASTIGGSGYFDGSGDYLSVANGAGLDLITNPFTVELLYYQTVSGDFYMFGRGGGDGSWSGSNGHEYLLFISGGTLYWMWNSGGTHAEIYTTAPSINQWHHVAVSYNGTTTRMWIDGVSIGTSNTGYYLPTTRNITYINNSPSGSGTAGTGYISNLRVVNGSAVYNPSSSTITVPTSPVTAITNTSLLTNFTNAGIPDAAMMNDLETVGNAQVSTSVKKYGTGSLYFDGTGDYLSIPNGPQTDFGAGDFTIEGWIYPTTYAGGSTTIIGKYTSGGAANQPFFIALQSAGTITCGINGTYDITTTATAPLNAWTHVAWTRSGNTFTVWLNGVSSATLTQSVTFNNPAIATTVGAFGLLGVWYFNGYIDDLRITKGVARYTANFTPPTSSLQNL